MDNIKSDTHCLSEDTKVLKEDSTKFSSRLDDHLKKLYSFTTLFDEGLGKMSDRNRVDRKIESKTS